VAALKDPLEKRGVLSMSRRTQWLSLLAGCLLIFLGLIKLYQESDYVLMILGLLIVAFTISSMTRSRQNGK
jgi:uncharacterized membrane protein HdeD (DUF308 family)